jgi:hypothetical protein
MKKGLKFICILISSIVIIGTILIIKHFYTISKPYYKFTTNNYSKSIEIQVFNGGATTAKYIVVNYNDSNDCKNKQKFKNLDIINISEISGNRIRLILGHSSSIGPESTDTLYY